MKTVTEGDTKKVADWFASIMNLPPEIVDQLWEDLNEAAQQNTFTKAWRVLYSYPPAVALKLQELKEWEPTETERVYLAAFGGLEGVAVDNGSRTVKTD